METDPVKYLTYPEAILHHIVLMQALGETRFGIFDRALLKSSLARPQHASNYGKSDLAAQAATLCYGLIRNHPWVGGNRRTATHLTDHFLRINGSEITTTTSEIVNMVNGVDAGTIDLAGLTEWMKRNVKTRE